jgi:hypothetical protein
MRQLHQKWCEKLHHVFRVLKVHRFEIPAHDAITDHLGRPAFPGHLVGIQGFAYADATIGSMGAFKTGMQALMSMIAITEAVAGHLMHHARSFSGGAISFNLGWRRKSLLSELLFCQDCWQNLSLGRRLIVKGWNIVLGQLGLSHGGNKNDNENPDRAFHNGDILLQNAQICELFGKVNFENELVARSIMTKERCCRIDV